MIINDLVKALADLKEEEALRIAKETLIAGEDPLNILDDCRNAMSIVGKRYEEGSYFISGLIMAGEILKELTKIVKPKLRKTVEAKRLGKVVIGTVEGDIHDIGKDIVIFMLDVNDFEVYDLGVDVPPKEFMKKVKEIKPEVVGLSGFLTRAIESMKKTIEAIKEAGLRDKVKIMIGGAQFGEDVAKYTGADAYGKDAMEAVSLCKRWVQNGKYT